MDGEIAGIFPGRRGRKQGDWFAVGDIVFQLFCKLLSFRSAAISEEPVLGSFGVGGERNVAGVVGCEAEAFLLCFDALAIDDGCVGWNPSL